MLVFAFAGVIGETLFSEWWKAFYAKSFWAYKVEAVAHSYTSFLNFIPWAIGGMLFLNILGITDGATLNYRAIAAAEIPFYLIFALALLVGLLIQWIVFHSAGINKFKHASLSNYLFFIFPFLLALAVCVLVYSPNFVGIAVAFGILGAFFEYLFGKACELFISKKLWTYKYLTIDNDHFTPLSLVPFSLAGFYFWGIALLLQSLLKNFFAIIKVL